jgi:hypothetical protein
MTTHAHRHGIRRRTTVVTLVAGLLTSAALLGAAHTSEPAGPAPSAPPAMTEWLAAAK